jgi:hypothetical protein
LIALIANNDELIPADWLMGIINKIAVIITTHKRVRKPPLAGAAGERAGVE